MAETLNLSRSPASRLEAMAVLNALPEPVFVIDREDCFASLNMAAEQFFEASASLLLDRPLAAVLPSDSPVFDLIRRAREGGYSVAEAGLTIEAPRLGTRFVSIVVAPLGELPGAVVVSLQERSIARKLDLQLGQRTAVRSVTAMAAMLAHEVKNPLSGIRGAAQLLERHASEGDKELTRLICDEADRIVELVDRMDMFAESRPMERTAVNIHEVLEHVRRLAQAGVARGVRFVETYDPSLPPVHGHRDLLIQALFNLVKNAAEAVPREDGEIRLATRYQHGLRLAMPGAAASRVDLPLMVTVQDNGPGIPDDLRPHLFDPFVTTKVGGRGLGLALVGKIIGDHGGVVEFDSEPRRTQFRLLLPKAPAGDDDQGRAA